MSPVRAHPEGWLTISEAERELGVARGSLLLWLRKNKRISSGTEKIGKYRYVRDSTLADYAQLGHKTTAVPRANKRPKGFIGIKQAMEVAQCGHTHLYKAAKQKEVRAVRVSKSYFFHRKDCEHLRLTLHNPPLPGYVKIQAVCSKHQSSRDHCIKWLRQNGATIKKFRDPQDHKLAWYTTLEHLEKWEQYIQGYKITQRRKLTIEQAQETIKRIKAGETLASVAVEYGVSETAIRNALQGKTYKLQEALTQVAS